MLHLPENVVPMPAEQRAELKRLAEAARPGLHPVWAKTYLGFYADYAQATRPDVVLAALAYTEAVEAALSAATAEAERCERNMLYYQDKMNGALEREHAATARAEHAERAYHALGDDVVQAFGPALGLPKAIELTQVCATCDGGPCAKAELCGARYATCGECAETLIPQAAALLATATDRAEAAEAAVAGLRERERLAVEAEQAHYIGDDAPAAPPAAAEAGQGDSRQVPWLPQSKCHGCGLPSHVARCQVADCPMKGVTDELD